MSTKPTNTGGAIEANIRLPHREDLSGILRLWNWAILNTAANFRNESDTLDHWIQEWADTNERYPWFVAESDGSIIGFAKASPFTGRCGYAYTAEVSVYVDASHHGEGVGRTLYGRLIPTLQAQGYHTLVAVIAVPNPPSERLHTGFGFREVGRLVHVGWKLGRWHDVAYWQRRLNDRDDSPGEIRPVAEVLRDAADGL